MSTALPTPVPGDNPSDAYADGHADAPHHHHDPNLAHHFDTPMQQYKSAKLGMWVFLATEILMFGGLFCAYGVYRHNHPDVFDFAHRYLNRPLGALNTIVLITSSLTMAWGVRAAQTNANRTLIICLALTVLGGAGFMAIKSIEYDTKWKEHVFVGFFNQYNADYKGPKEGLTGGEGLKPEGPIAANARAEAAMPKPATAPAVAAGAPRPFSYADGNTGTADESKIKPNFLETAGLAPRMTAAHAEHEIRESDLSAIDHARINAFFSVYFLMTGLHGIHVLVGMSLIFWILRRALPHPARHLADALGIILIGAFGIYLGFLLPSRGTLVVGIVITVAGVIGAVVFGPRARQTPAGAVGEFSEHYFTPVDLVGLYWHLVDLIWIFLFPLLYLIH